GDDPSRAGGAPSRAGDVLSRDGDAFRALTDVSPLETCVPMRAGGVWIRVGDAPSTAGDACLALTRASYEETSRSYDVGDESLRAGDDLPRVDSQLVRDGDLSLRLRQAFHALREVPLLETSVLSSARGAWRHAGATLFAR
ncbi:MAG TPA: hypothetical protein VGY54_23770, partial [Polyangiaceae bacterium]|nr:hypothetical protein [Polyangiaceae bacterium]